MPTAGYPKSQNVPGRWRFLIHHTITANGFTAFDLRTDTCFGSCPWMTAEQKLLAKSEGVLKAVYMVHKSGDGSVKWADSADPGAHYVTCDASTGLNLQYPKEAGISQVYVDTDNVAVTVECEVWFDLRSE
jgi:hypothetical protein